MTESSNPTTGKKNSKADNVTPDLSTPYASAMKMWQGELDRFFGAASDNLDKTLSVQKRLIDEQARFAEAQMTASQDAMRVFADGMQRVVRAGTAGA
jgi:hypothetical protein